MKRGEFIKIWCDQKKVPEDQRTIYGWNSPYDEHVFVALPCGCGECKGWAMIRDDQIGHHMQFNWPEDLDFSSAWCGPE